MFDLALWLKSILLYTAFFLRLPFGQYDPVSQLSCPQSCIGPFDWSRAHCAGENLKLKTGPFLPKSLFKNKQTNRKGPPRQQPPARLSGTRAKKQHTTRPQETWYALTYIEMSWRSFNLGSKYSDPYLEMECFCPKWLAMASMWWILA